MANALHCILESIVTYVTIACRAVIYLYIHKDHDSWVFPLFSGIYGVVLAAIHRFSHALKEPISPLTLCGPSGDKRRACSAGGTRSLYSFFARRTLPEITRSETESVSSVSTAVGIGQSFSPRFTPFQVLRFKHGVESEESRPTGSGTS